MSGTDAPKSSIELAMERLRQKDADGGVERRPLSDEQKAAIVELRSLYGAKLAQAEVLHQSKTTRTFDPSELTVLEDEYRRERERLTSDLDAKIDKVRSAAPSSP